jgi:hypothetical protein
MKHAFKWKTCRSKKEIHVNEGIQQKEKTHFFHQSDNSDRFGTKDRSDGCSILGGL